MVSIDAATLYAAEFPLRSELLEVVEELALVVWSLHWFLDQREEFLHFWVNLCNYLNLA